MNMVEKHQRNTRKEVRKMQSSDGTLEVKLRVIMCRV